MTEVLNPKLLEKQEELALRTAKSDEETAKLKKENVAFKNIQAKLERGQAQGGGQQGQGSQSSLGSAIQGPQQPAGDISQFGQAPTAPVVQQVPQDISSGFVPPQPATPPVPASQLPTDTPSSESGSLWPSALVALSNVVAANRAGRRQAPSPASFGASGGGVRGGPLSSAIAAPPPSGIGRRRRLV